MDSKKNSAGPENTPASGSALLPSPIPPVDANLSKASRKRDLQIQIEELKKRWPAHSTPAWMIQRLDELEDELAAELKKNEGKNVA